MRKIILFLALLSLLIGGCSSKKDYYAWNYPQALDANGLTVQVGRVLLAKPGTFDDKFFKDPYFQDKKVLVELIFVVQNNSGGTRSVYPMQGLVKVNGEQVNLWDASLNGHYGESTDGEILAGVTKIGGLWFGLRRSELEDVKNMDVIISAPFDVNSAVAGGEYHFKLDLSDPKHDEMPDELK